MDKGRTRENRRPRIALTMRITEAQGYSERRDSLSHDWVNLLEDWGMSSLPIPNGLGDPDEYFDSLDPDLFVLTGGDDPGKGTPRDLTEKKVLDYAKSTGIPTIGICRGLQAINLHFGGRLTAIDNHVGCDHAVSVSGAFAEIYGTEASVNSFHEMTIPLDGLAEDLIITARDEDGNIEAFHHGTLPVAAIMWHPERRGAPTTDRLLFENLIGQGAFWL